MQSDVDGQQRNYQKWTPQVGNYTKMNISTFEIYCQIDGRIVVSGHLSTVCTDYIFLHSGLAIV